MKYPFVSLVAVLLGSSSIHAQPRPAEVYRFELEMNQQMCTRPDGGDYVCGTDGNRSIVEVSLDRAEPDALEDSALYGESDPVGLALSGNMQHLPVVSVRKSMVAGTSIYTLRFRTRRSGDAAAPVYETVYIEDATELELRKPLTLMADRLENSPRFFRQVFLTLGKLP